MQKLTTHQETSLGPLSLSLSLSLSSGEEWDGKGDGFRMIYHRFQPIKTKLTWGFAKNRLRQTRPIDPYPFCLYHDLSLWVSSGEEQNGKGDGFQRRREKWEGILLKMNWWEREREIHEAENDNNTVGKGEDAWKMAKDKMKKMPREKRRTNKK